MRIIGGKDYYDSARAFGADTEIVFTRQNHTAIDAVESRLGLVYAPELDCTHLRHRYVHRSGGFLVNGVEHLFSGVAIWFAGKLYRGVKHSHRRDGVISDDVEYIWYYDRFMSEIDKLDLFLKELVWRRKETGRFDQQVKQTEREVQDFFTVKEPSREQLDFIIAKKIAVAIGVQKEYKNLWYYNKEYKNLWYYNTDGLKHYEFQKRLDPYQAFQELSMFIGGVLPRQGNPMIELTGEKIMLNKHGFDKWTFRKQPSAKR